MEEWKSPNNSDDHRHLRRMLNVRLLHQCSAKMSTAHPKWGQGITKIIQNALCNKLRFHSYKIQILHEMKYEHHYTRAEFANLMLSASDDTDSSLQQVMYTNVLQINGHVNGHNYHIWGQDGPYEIYKHVSYLLPLWCGMMHDPIIRPFTCAENTIVANIYLDM